MATEGSAGPATGKESSSGDGAEGATTRKRSTSAAAKKAPSKRAAAPRAQAPRAAAPKRMSGTQVAAAAAQQLLELTGKEAEGVTGLERNDEGWTIQVEVLELRRIPNTTDVLATYEVTVDADGELEGYQRLRRYVRGVPGDN